jgi:hypothetical protein
VLLVIIYSKSMKFWKKIWKFYITGEHYSPHPQSKFVLLRFLDRMELRSVPSLDDLMLHASTCVCLCPLKRI